MRYGWVLVATACTGGAEEPALTLEGPSEVRVEKLGPVDGPRVLRADGTEPEGVQWSVSDAAVAEIRGDDVLARGPGKAEVTGVLGDDKVVWTLTVDPALTVGFVSPPANLAVGASVELGVEVRAGETVVPTGAMDWVTSDPAILTVTSGKATGVAPGLAYVTARRGTSEAMVQLEVVP